MTATRSAFHVSYAACSDTGAGAEQFAEPDRHGVG
jgi:hypothetical protein